MNFDKKKVFCFAAVFGILIGVYLYTIAPTVSLWDCGEFIACSHILGVPHPPGTPFYVLLGRIFDILFPFREVAKRINFLSALSGALAGAILYLVILKVLSRLKDSKDKKPLLGAHLIAAFSSIGAGFCFSVWDSSVEAEVYALSILIMILSLWLTLHWSDHRQEKGDNNYLILLVYLLFLSIGVHLLPLLIVPGVIVFLILIDWKALKDPRFLGIALLLAFVGISTYFFLMIRAHANPYINEANPTTFSKLWDVFSRKQYGEAIDLLPRHTSWETNLGLIPAFIEQLKVFLKYFSWQFFPYPRTDTGVLLRFVSLFGTYMYVLIGIWGMWIHFKEDKESFWLFFILYILVSIGLVVYLNHEFSPSDPNPAHQPREPRERDYFWNPAFFLFMFYVAIGLHWIWMRLKRKTPRYALGCIIFSGVLGFIPLVSNIKSHANRRGNWIAHDYARALLVSPDDNSVIFTYGDNDTFPVWFLQGVKDFRRFDADKKKGVRLANFSLMNTNWYVKQLKWSKIPIDFVSPFRGTRFASEYNRQKKLGMTNVGFEEWIMDSVPPGMRLADGRIIELKDIAVRSIILSAIEKKPTLKDLFMELDLFVERYIDNGDFNPSINIYFSFPIPPEYREALSAHLLREGFAYKLVKEKVDFNSNREKTWDLFNNKFSYSYYDNFWMCIGSEAQVTILINFAFSLFTFGNEVFSDFYPILHREVELKGPDRDTLEMLSSLFNKVLIYAEEENFFFNIAAHLMLNQKLIYKKLKNYDEGIEFANSSLQVKDVPRLRLFRGELLLLKAKHADKTGEVKNLTIEAETDFEKLRYMEGWGFFAYKGLFEVYVNLGEEEKLKDVMDELIKDRRVLSDIFLLLKEENIDLAIELIKRLRNRFPADKSLDKVLDGLKTR
jgi:tetratricopeptide (TPR) repeat protein